MLRFDNRVRLNFEQQVLPCMFYCEFEREHFRRRFLKKGEIFHMLDLFYQVNGEKNPYTKDQIRVSEIRIDADTSCLCVTMPPTDHPSGSERILMLYNEAFDKLAYYLVEHGWSERWIAKVKYEFNDRFIPVNDSVKADEKEELAVALTDFDPKYAAWKEKEEGEALRAARDLGADESDWNRFTEELLSARKEETPYDYRKTDGCTA